MVTAARGSCRARASPGRRRGGESTPRPLFAAPTGARRAGARTRAPRARGSSPRRARRRRAPAVAVGRCAGLDVRAGRQVAATSSSLDQSPTASPGAERGAQASSPRARARPRRCAGVASASAWRNVAVRGHATVDLHPADVASPRRARRPRQVGAPVRDSLEHGAHDVGPVRPAGQADERAAGAVVPVRRAEAEQRRARTRRRRCRRTTRRRASDCLGRVDQAEVVAQPLDVRAGGEHHALEAPASVPADAPRHDREGARRRPGRSRAARRRARRRACRRCRT